MKQSKIEIYYDLQTLPAVHGITSKDKNKYFMLINAGESPDEQAAAFIHEMLHIWNRDFESKDSLQEIEARTREQAKRILSLLAEE